LLILETGLGGRLDAVNTVAADIAIITTVDYDHQDWLGDDLVGIAREKAGIIHKNCIAIIADPDFPASIIDEIRLTTDKLYLADKDFQHLDSGESWSWQNNRYGSWEFQHLTFPFSNASAAIQAWSLLPDTTNLSEEFISLALTKIKLSGRFETIANNPDVIIDVAHNPQAFRVQLEFLEKQHCTGKTHLILGMLTDKNAADCIEVLKPIVMIVINCCNNCNISCNSIYRI